jgi:hypothetical protein
MNSIYSNQIIDEMIQNKKYSMLDNYVDRLIYLFNSTTKEQKEIKEQYFEAFYDLLHKLVKISIENQDFKLLKLPLYYYNETRNHTILVSEDFLFNTISETKQFEIIDKLILSKQFDIDNICSIAMRKNDIPILNYLLNHDAIICATCVEYNEALIKKDINALEKITQIIQNSDNYNFSVSASNILIASKIGFTEALDLFINLESPDVLEVIDHTIHDINYLNTEFFCDLLTYTENHKDIVKNLIKTSEWIKEQNDKKAPSSVFLEGFNEEKLFLTLIKAIHEKEELLSEDCYEFHLNNQYVDFVFLAQILLFEAFYYLKTQNEYLDIDFKKLYLGVYAEEYKTEEIYQRATSLVEKEILEHKLNNKEKEKNKTLKV